MSTHLHNSDARQGASSSGGRRPHGKVSYFGIGASLLVLLGSFLPWVEASLEGSVETIKGTDGDGKWTMAAAVVAMVLFIVGVVARKPIISGSAAVPSLVAVVFGAWNIANPERLARVSIEDESGGMSSTELDGLLQQFDFSAMGGLWIVVAGAALGVLFGVLAAAKTRQR
ncbi:hypothetical protein [Embleya hyalina]|uniref:Uncharacterized protein n=1 Tax=Embleya hyalina TaxID=516124 RepID=A0A401YQD9_9ACTN|nr:hypothetical protein [Embleya hyalina]GCD96819.1 hypothetical protein EHYA_04506 [Embleya hyalina]